MPIGPKDPAEIVVVTIDFSLELGSETISSIVSVVASVLAGTDATPSAILSGAATIVGGAVLQTVIGGVLNVTYLLKATITTSGARTLVGTTIMPMVLE